MTDDNVVNDYEIRRYDYGTDSEDDDYFGVGKEDDDHRGDA